MHMIRVLVEALFIENRLILIGIIVIVILLDCQIFVEMISEINLFTLYKVFEFYLQYFYILLILKYLKILEIILK